MDKVQLLAVTNMFVCMAIAFICVCRLNKTTGGVLLRVRSQYAVFLNCALASAWAPLWGEWPGVASLAMACGILFYLSVNARNWVGGPPQNCMTREALYGKPNCPPTARG